VKIHKSREMSSFLFLVALMLLVGIVNHDFLKPAFLVNCFNDSVVFTFLAAGSCFVLLTGEIDVSVGAVLGLSSAVGATILRDGGSVVTATLAAIGVGVVVGFINGVGVAIFNIPSLIFTLGTNGVARGLIYVYTKGHWVENLPGDFTRFASKPLIGGLTIVYAGAILIVAGTHLILQKTRRGRYFVAVGDNSAGANLVGIPVTLTKVVSYLLCAVFASIAGMIYASRVGFITPIAGGGYEMKAIAACVLGGVSLTGGVGSILGAGIGAVIMSSISRILVFLGFSSDYDNTITGVILLTIVVVNTVLQNRQIITNRRNILLKRTTGKNGGES